MKREGFRRNPSRFILSVREKEDAMVRTDIQTLSTGRPKYQVFQASRA